MSLKLIVKNLNVNNLESSYSREFDSINLSTTSVDELINQIVGNCSKIKSTTIELLYRGQILNRSCPLKEYLSETSPACLYLIENRYKVINQVRPSINDISNFVSQVNWIFKSKSKRIFLEKLLQNSDRLNDLIFKSVPDLKYDATSFSFIQSYDLLKLLADQARCDQIIQKYPNVYYGVRALIDYIRENVSKSDDKSEFVSKGSFSIDEISEDEEHQSNQASTSQAASARRPQGPVITQDYLSSVLASLSQQFPQQQQQQQPPTQTQPAAQPTQNRVIERNYFEGVMQQLLNPSNPTQNTTSQPQNMTQSNASALSDEELAAKLESMHEFGFLDDELNVRALQIAEGNVEAAINFIVESGGGF